MNISPNFTLNEFIVSKTAIDKKIDNTPTLEILSNINLLCMNILEPLRTLIKEPIHVSSGYRCLLLNKEIGGSKTSQHLEGKAADISCRNIPTEQLYKFIINSNLKYDQIIQEFDKWVHISWNGGHNRNERLRATKDENNNTVYTKEQ